MLLSGLFPLAIKGTSSPPQEQQGKGKQCYYWPRRTYISLNKNLDTPAVHAPLLIFPIAASGNVTHA